MNEREVADKLSGYKVLVSKHFDIDKILFLGSYAIGNQKDDGDIDVAIIVNSVGQDYFSYASLLRKL